MKKFKKAYIEITNNCNLNCSFCPKTKREKKFMTENEFKEVIEKIKPYVNFLYLHLMGEPLMHPKLKELLDISYENKMKINITTNGTLLKNKIDILKESKALRKISISLHSFEANENENFNEYIDGVIYSVKELNANDKEVVLKLWNIDSTNKDANDKEGKNKLNSTILDLIISNLSDIYNEGKKEAILRELFTRGTCEIKKRIYLQLGEKFEWPINTSNEKHFEKIFCYGSVDQFGVLVNGDIVPCCLDSEGIIKLGNIFEKDLKEILESNEYIDFNKKIKEGIPPTKLCEKCSYARKKV